MEIRTKIMGVFLSPNSEKLGDKQKSWGSKHNNLTFFACTMTNYTVYGASAEGAS